MPTPGAELLIEIGENNANSPIDQKVLTDFHAADFVQQFYRVDEKGHGKLKLLFQTHLSNLTHFGSKEEIISGLTGLINAGRQAAEIGGFHFNQIAEYKQAALRTIALGYVNYCTKDKLNYNPKQAERFIDGFREVAGSQRADETILTEFFRRELKQKQQSRNFLIENHDNLANAKNELLPETDQQSQNKQGFFTNFESFGLLKYTKRTEKTLKTAMQQEIRHLGIGTELEQMRFLTRQALAKAALPLLSVVSAAGVSLYALLPFFIHTVQIQTTRHELITADPKTILIFESLLLLFGAGITKLTLFTPFIMEQAKKVEQNVALVIDTRRKFINTGKASGTPEINI